MLVYFGWAMKTNELLVCSVGSECGVLLLCGLMCCGYIYNLYRNGVSVEIPIVPLPSIQY